MVDYLKYGPVLITRGEHKGRIGYYDDDFGTSFSRIMIYPNMPNYCNRYYTVRRSSATSIIPTESLAKRWEAIDRAIICNSFQPKLSSGELTDLLYERIFCSDLLNERYFLAMGKIENQSKPLVFISHSSVDLIFARCIATDLLNAGLSVFLDDWSISVGDRIFDRINQGLEESIALVMIISESYLNSVCCNDEWSAFYNKALHMQKCRIFPLIIDHSKAPMILSQIKYLRIDNDEYSTGLSALLKALKTQFSSN